ncbi:Fungal specific transcription protein [Lasiodiplodia theobromae]|uniref:Fungal specific transcription protein n=1 Tax=Lasiodiplodia theobromae TaxID=45133 RepID=UPI0015C2D8E5|nr:Fungal specific transcription protein [Lasiodiplodia theobromae]KAF4536117.1 Fungal specific transcription protein [Lasiodiplodia theobromae]
MTKNRRRSTPAGSSSSSTASRTSHSDRRHPTSIPRLLLAFAALVALLAAAVILLPASSSSSLPVVEHMQRFFHHRAVSPLVSRFYANSNKISSSTPSYYYSTKNTMSADSSNANTVDADSFHPKGSSSSNDDVNTNNNGQPILPLPAPEEPGAALKLDLGGDGVKLDALGPMVVNTDGSLSRIANWDRMAEIEKRNTLRIIGKRNKERLAALKAEGEGNA